MDKVPEPETLHERVEHYAVLAEAFVRKMHVIGPMTPPEEIAITGLIAAARAAVNELEECRDELREVGYHE